MKTIYIHNLLSFRSYICKLNGKGELWKSIYRATISWIFFIYNLQSFPFCHYLTYVHMLYIYSFWCFPFAIRYPTWKGKDRRLYVRATKHSLDTIEDPGSIILLRGLEQDIAIGTFGNMHVSKHSTFYSQLACKKLTDICVLNGIM